MGVDDFYQQVNTVMDDVNLMKAGSQLKQYSNPAPDGRQLRHIRTLDHPSTTRVCHSNNGVAINGHGQARMDTEGQTSHIRGV